MDESSWDVMSFNHEHILLNFKFSSSNENIFYIKPLKGYQVHGFDNLLTFF